MKKCKYFGTDGIRGLVTQQFSADFLVQVANAVAFIIHNEVETRTAETSQKPKVIIGHDTRQSCQFMIHIISGTLASHGIDVVNVGTVPTAALSFLTSKLKADLGIMVSASHNSIKYNGIKFFSHTGGKLSDDSIYEFDRLIEKREKPRANVTEQTIGTITQNLKAISIWQKFLLAKFRPVFHTKKESEKIIQKPLKIAIDCAFGSGAQCADKVMRGLGFDVCLYNDKSSGFDINCDCGATKPSNLSAVMKGANYDIGFAFDGDADRCIVFDEKGDHVHGDAVIFLLAKYLKNKGALKNNKIAGTIMFNLGAEKSLNREGIKLIRTDVGDAKIYHAVKSEKLSIGGEDNGHVNFPHIWCTGDGLVTALMVLSMLNSSSIKLSELCNDVSIYPYVNFTVEADSNQKKQLFANSDFKSFLVAQKKEFQEYRIIVRPSGTENIVRVTVEGQETSCCEKIALQIINKIKQFLGKY